MKLWLLKPRQEWTWRYDKTHGCVVRAPDEAQARILASTVHGDEGAAVWLSPDVTTCVELTPDGLPGVVLRDFQSG